MWRLLVILKMEKKVFTTLDVHTSLEMTSPTTDRISDLPDSILTHILSTLPTKHAATTSFLSKRWKPLWLSIPTLHIDDDDETFKDFNSFIQFIFSVIFSLRDNTVTVPSFRFNCRRFHSLLKQDDFNQILHFAMQIRGVKNLTIQFPNKNVPIKLLPSILSFNMLEVLTFENIEIGDYDHVDFPRVKTLHLSNVSFGNREYIVKFLLGFPVLENLQTELNVNVYRPKQKFETSIALPNLVKVRICDSYTPLSLVCKANTLYVEQTLWMVGGIEFPMFHNLTHLELGYQATRLCFRKCAMLLGILPYFPKLQHFIIQDGVDAMKLEVKHWTPISTVPECLSSQLKTCLIRGYRDTTCEFEFVKYIMKHSRVLETMTINSIGLTKNETLEKLSSCTRGSTTCKLLFD